MILVKNGEEYPYYPDNDLVVRSLPARVRALSFAAIDPWPPQVGRIGHGIQDESH